MPQETRRQQREQKLRDAIHTAAGFTLADRWLFTTFLWIADFGTANLPPRFQPRSAADLAKRSHMSARQVKYSLSHLEQHGWIVRTRFTETAGAPGGRSHPTHYTLLQGADCDCKQGSQCTVPAPRMSPESVQALHSSSGEACSECTGNCAEGACVCAGQDADSAGRAVAGGIEEEAPFMIEVAGEWYEAEWCRGCSSPVAIEFAVFGCHASCLSPEEAEQQRGHTA
jgi:hypothetical protein